jgi:non-heme chloroperoxidase
MKNKIVWLSALVALSAGAQQSPPKQLDQSIPAVQFVNVDKDVKLEVIDWGGSGRPLVFLSGLGDTARVFDAFAPKFIAKFHVYGITRRGFGASTAPAPDGRNYSADRLGDDVLAVVEALKLDRPVLVGHSIAGEELSSIGSRHPEKVSGLIYLDAAQGYAFYDGFQGDLGIDLNDMQKKLYQLTPLEDRPQELRALVLELLKADIPQLRRDLGEWQGQLEVLEKQLENIPDGSSEPAVTLTPQMQITNAILESGAKYTHIRCPILAIFAFPHSNGATSGESNADAAAEADSLSHLTRRANAFEAGIPSAHVVRLANADHYVFRSNEAEVIHEMDTFLEHLP